MFFTENEGDIIRNCQQTTEAPGEGCDIKDQPEANCCKSELAHCQQKLEESQQKGAEWERKYMLALADYDNLKRRSEKETESIRLQAQSRVLGDMLTTLDNFDRAFESVPAESATQFAGFDLIRKDVSKKLQDLGVQEMDNYASFNPEFHEALVQVPADETHAAGSIVSVLQKGYLFKGSVLRHAKVSVAN